MDLESKAGVSEADTKKDSSPYKANLPEYLASAYEVLRKIFSFLPLEDIENAGKAYESWKPIADLARAERCCIESFVISHHKYKMAKIWSEADFCICFSTMNKKRLEEKLTKYTTPGAEFCHCLTGAGVIGTVNDLSQLVQQKIKIECSSLRKKYYFSALRIPSMPKVGIKTFLWEEGMDFASFRSSFDIPPNEIVKCVIILMVTQGSVQRANMQINDFIHFLQARQKMGFALGGSVVDGFGNGYDNDSANSVVKYIVFYGDNVSSASTVLTADVKSVESVNEKIELLKEMCPDTKKGALFIFRCAGRQRIIRRNKLDGTGISKWEGESLQKHFPTTPMVGCYGYGEFGRDHPADKDYIIPLKKLKLFNWEFSFSTSLVYVGFRN